MVKDYYQILEVDREADEKTIKSAYRRLANQWHPDKHQNDTEEVRKRSEEKFKDLSEAYSVLSDPEKKANYDSTGNPDISGRGFGFRTTGDPFDIFGGLRGFRTGPSHPQPMRGQSIQTSLELSLVESLFGVEKQLQFSVNSPCSKCGTKGGLEFETCATCHGAGITVVRQPNVIMQSTCGDCRGQGNKITKLCDVCSGRGVVLEPRDFGIKTPPSLKNGSTLKIAGAAGQGFNGGPPGDVILHVSVNYPDLSSISEEEKAKLVQLLDR